MIVKGQNNIVLTRPAKPNHWIHIGIYGGWSTGAGVEFPNFYLNFQDGSSLTLEQAVHQKYIEPLAVIGNSSDGESHIYLNILNIIQDGFSGVASYPTVYMYLKSKFDLIGYQFIASRDFATDYDGTRIYEYEGVDLTLGK